MTLLIAHVAVTWFMVGLIWVVQIVHYPLFRQVGAEAFELYETGHTRRMGAVLAVPAPIEVVTAALLVWHRPDTVPMWIVLAAGTVLAAIWVITAIVQAPLHGRLSRRRDEDDLRRLVSSNWWRTTLWSARGVAVAAMLAM